MYLREALLRNSGPIRDLHLELAFHADGRPVPHLIVGRNGSGKTNLLSMIADALMEGAANVYSDVLVHADVGRNWFRIVGGRTVTYQETTGFSILRFDHENLNLFYRENSGQLTPEQAKESVPTSLAEGVNWSNDGKHSKQFSIPEETVRSIYPAGAYGFFPSSRSETPYWLNQASLRMDEFDTTDRFSQQLGKPLFIEHGIDDFAQWLLGVLTESRPEVTLSPDPASNQMRMDAVNGPLFLTNMAVLSSANSILQMVMDDPNAKFYWAGRRQPRKVGVAIGDQPVASGLDSLSGGQSSLLAVFGTILRHGDATGSQPSELQGIVVIDELDAHMHIDLQIKALPNLIAFFPKVQFILSSHSPFFSLGMERQFGDAGVRIIELPSGLALTAEAYSEFGNALDALRDTRTFEKEVGALITSGELPIILVGGETDLPYFRTAAKLLGFPDLVDRFEWIGAPGQSGGGFNTGDSALTAAVNFFKSNPGFTKRQIVVVFDCDANKSNESVNDLHVIAIPTIPGRKATKGIENLLPDSALTSNFYPQKTVTGPYGEEKVIQISIKLGCADTFAAKARR